MSWSVRHEGSPQSVRNLSTAAVLDGLAAGEWETTDEVRPDSGGPWQPLEQHPDFADAAAEVEAVIHDEPPDETRLDMNPLIDVSLVLLIFFILTTTHATIRKVLDMPSGNEAKGKSGVQKSKLERVKEFAIRIDARRDGGTTRVKVEDKEVAFEDLPAELGKYVRASAKRQVLLDAQGVEWGVVVQIMDAAKSAGVEKTLLVDR